MHPSRSRVPNRQEGALRIAVTGASGRIGGQVVRLLAAEQQQLKRPETGRTWTLTLTPAIYQASPPSV